MTHVKRSPMVQKTRASIENIVDRQNRNVAKIIKSKSTDFLTSDFTNFASWLRTHFDKNAKTIQHMN